MILDLRKVFDRVKSIQDDIENGDRIVCQFTL